MMLCHLCRVNLRTLEQGVTVEFGQLGLMEVKGVLGSDSEQSKNYPFRM